MKICKTQDINNNVYIVTVVTSDFSENDIKLMADFGEPTINIGGDFEGVPALAEGSNDMSSGNDWSLGSEDIEVNINGGGIDVITLDSAYTTDEEIISAINAKFAAAEIAATAIPSETVTGGIDIRSNRTGVDVEMVLSGAALVTLGITADTYNGSGLEAAAFSIADQNLLVKNESPFVQRFDARDEEAEGDAEKQAIFWGAEIITRIKAAMDALRANADEFSGESCETY